jgi:hypothetical protein
MYLKTTILLIVFAISSLCSFSQNDTKNMYLRASGFVGLFRVSNGDHFRQSTVLDGGNAGLHALFDYKVPKQDNFFVTLGGGKEFISSTYKSSHLINDSLINFTQKIEIETVNIYGAATYRLYESGGVVGISGTIGLFGIIPTLSKSTIEHVPEREENTYSNQFSSKKFTLAISGNLNLELYVSQNVFIHLGLAYTSGVSSLYKTANGYNTTTSGSAVTLGAGVCF